MGASEREGLGAWIEGGRDGEMRWEREAAALRARLSEARRIAEVLTVRRGDGREFSLAEISVAQALQANGTMLPIPKVIECHQMGTGRSPVRAADTVLGTQFIHRFHNRRILGGEPSVLLHNAGKVIFHVI